MQNQPTSNPSNIDMSDQQQQPQQQQICKTAFARVYPMDPYTNPDWIYSRRATVPAGKAEKRAAIEAEPDPAKKVKLNVSLRNDKGNVNGWNKRGMLPLQYHPEEFQKWLFSGADYAPNSASTHIGCASRIFQGFQDDDKAGVVEAMIRTSLPSHLVDPVLERLPREARIEIFKDRIHKPYQDYNCRKSRNARAGKENENQMPSQTQKEKYIPYHRLIDLIKAELLKNGDLSDAKQLGNYCVFLWQLVILLGDKAGRLELAMAAFDGQESRCQYDVDAHTFTTDDRTKTYRSYTCTIEDDFLKQKLDALVAARRSRNQKHLFLHNNGNYSRTKINEEMVPWDADHCAWLGRRAIDLNKGKKANIGRVGVTALRLSLAVYLHREWVRRGSPLAYMNNYILERMDHTRQVQDSYYSLILEDDDPRIVTIPSEDKLNRQGGGQGGSSGDDEEDGEEDGEEDESEE
jgi:hypothetical protein